MKVITYNGDMLSKLSLGTVQFGLDYGIANRSGKTTEIEANQIIDYLYLHGLNCFDTAQDYGDSEKVLGNALQNKDSLYIFSKLKSVDFKNQLEKKVVHSLSRLKIDSLYALLLHDSILLHEWNKEYSQMVHNLINNKKIKYFGVSIYTNQDFDLAIENDTVQVIQIPFNIFDQRAIEQEWFQRAKKKNKLILVRSVFLQGLLLMNKEDIPESLNLAKRYVEQFEELCDRLKVTKHELCLIFVNSVSKEGLLLFGCDNLTQAKQNLDIFNRLEVLDIEIINEIFSIFKNVPESIYNPSKWIRK